jgi:two-component system response regulator FixJ
VTQIYIVDDHESFGRSLKRLLTVKGHEVEYFSSADLFLETVTAAKIQGIAIIDIYMPECDGFSLMDRMREIGIKLPVIVITGHDNPDAEKLAMRYGAVGFLRKPVDEESLLTMICLQGSGNPE